MKFALRTMSFIAFVGTTALFSAHTAVSANTTHNAALSGSIHYSMDPQEVQQALSHMGVKNLPAPYYAATLVSMSGFESVHIARKDDPLGMSISITSLDTNELRKKAHAIEHQQAQSSAAASPEAKAKMAQQLKTLVGSLKSLTKGCKSPTTRSIQTANGPVPVTITSCKLLENYDTVSQEVHFKNPEHPIVLHGMTLDGKFDTPFFDSIVNEVSAPE